MGNKKAVLISCTDHYRERMYIFDNALSELGYCTEYVASDFHHIKKEPFKCSTKGALQLHVRHYAKNLSVDRILSHRDFARGVYSYLENLAEEPEIIISEIPPNFLVKYLAKYKKRHPNVKLVFDIFDLWPETFPSSRLKKLLAPAFAVWAGLRDKNLPKADLIITECNLYRKVLKNVLEGLNCNTVYLSKSDKTFKNDEIILPKDSIELCYLGSINNVIDIDTIAKLVSETAKLKRVRVNIIGDGENKDTFIERLKDTSAEVVFHGKIYDDLKKQEIFNRCHFGLNVMKASVCIGLTMKSIDYFSAGLPILNSVGADTCDLVKDKNIGININRENLVETAKQIVDSTNSENLKMRENVICLFEKEFSDKVISEKIKAEIIKPEEL